MTSRGRAPVDVAALRARLAGTRGPGYWRLLEDFAGSQHFVDWLEERAPRFAAAASGALDRRRFLQLMAASLALSGLGACGPEPEPRELLPYVEEPPGVVPGRPRYFATATLFDGFAEGVLVEHEMGRPIKVEGNPDHPASLGATSAIGQAAILGLYDPHRAEAVTEAGAIAPWERLVATIAARREALAARHGEGLRLLTGTVTSPTLAAQLGALGDAFPAMRWHQWEPLHRDAERAGAQLAFGRPVDTVLDLAKADVVLGIESDLVATAPGRLRYANDLAARRRADEVGAAMSRIYAIESTPTLLGAKADHRLMRRPAGVEGCLRHLAAALGAAPQDWMVSDAAERRRLDAIASDLKQHRGRALVHAGREQGAATHALVHLLNDALGATGETVRPIAPVEAAPIDETKSLADLVADIDAGKVDTLVILGVNAVYSAPVELDVAGALARVPLAIYLGPYADETAERCRWHVPETHEFEAWSDARAFDGTVGILQPQVRPLHAGRSPHELLAVLAGDTRPDGRGILLRHWQAAAAAAGERDFDAFWRGALRKGVVDGSAAPPLAVSLRQDLARDLPPPRPDEGDRLALLFRPDIGVWDGRFAANAWLQEMPRPLTRLTWDNAALLAPATAARLDLADGDVVELSLDGRRLRAPVSILPGQAPDCVTLPLGFGRAAAGPVGTGVGFDAYRLRPADRPWEAAGADLARTGERHAFAAEQRQAEMQGRDLVRSGDLADFLADPRFLARPEPDISLYPRRADGDIAWAMSISLDACIGCQACVIACQAENNIPVVGKEEVRRGRAMHWLRIDRYYEGGRDEPATHFQPVPCMHCENAPCEIVCPVQATVHDHEGLNVMVYNRCVGTRFCSNNCPYKVRRFNFFGFAEANGRPRESWNPEVSVRGRGVMEKCTYCVQRIRAAASAAEREGRAVAEGEVVTACQQACPTRAIVFGNRNDPASAVARLKASPLDYALLDELNTRPRTTYRAAIRNRNRDFEHT